MTTLLLSIITTLSLIAACTGAPTATPTPTSAPTPSLIPSPSAAASSPTPVIFTPPPATPGGVLSAIVTSDIPHRDVHQTTSETLATRGPGISYSRLLRLKDAPPDSQPSLLLECDVCQSWQILDPVTFLFQLREGVRWQNLAPVHGRRLTASDIVYSYDRQRTAGWPNAPLLNALASSEAVDDYTLKLTLQRPDVDFLLALADGHSKIVAREAVEASGGLKEGPVVGTGPWIWQSTQRGEGSEFIANPNYFEKGLPFPARLSFKFIADPQTQAAAILGGVVDVVETLSWKAPPETLQELQSQIESLPTLLSRRVGQGSILAMNVSKPPFDDSARRKALFDDLGIYEASIWEKIGFLGVGVIPVVEPSWYPPSEDLESIRGLAIPTPVAGSAVDVELTVGDFGDDSLGDAHNLMGELRDAGFNPTLRILNPGQYSEKVWQQKDYKIFIGPVPPSSSPSGFLFSVLHSQGQWNILQHKDPELNRLIEAQAAFEYHSPERAEAFRAIHRHLLAQAYLVSYAPYSVSWSYQPRVQGFHPNLANSEYFFWARTWIKP